MGMFGGSGRASRLQMIQSAMEAEEQKKRQAAAESQTQDLLKQANEQAARQSEQLSKENEAIRSQLEKVQQVAERPDPPPPPPAAVMVTGGSAADLAGEEGGIAEAKKRGRSALRIDMNAAQSGSNASGLNVPRG